MLLTAERTLLAADRMLGPVLTILTAERMEEERDRTYVGCPDCNF